MSESSMVEEPPTPRSELSVKKKTPRRSKIKAPNDLQKIFHTMRQENSLYYFSKAKSVKPVERVEDEHSKFTGFDYPNNQEHFAFKNVSAAWRNKLLQQEHRKKNCCKTNFKTRLRTDILERLYVEDPEEIKKKTLLDIDPEFYTIVEARPIQRIHNMSKYLGDIRNVLRTKLMAGFRNDETLLLDEKLKRETAAITQLKDDITTYVHSFELSLSEDYNESMTLLREAERAAYITMEKTELIRHLHTENAALEFTVHKLEERWRDLKMYQKFLYFVSPITWRMQYDYIHRKELHEDIDTQTSTIFKKYALTSQGHLPSLTNLVDEYLECIVNEEEPVLYFTNTDQLVKVFRFIEIQNLNCLLHTEEIEIPMENMKATMEETKKNFEKEAVSIKKMIEELTRGIEWEESCSKDLEEMAMKQIDGTFRNLISDDEVLKLHVFIEDVYDKCIAKNESEIGLYDMIIAIEQAYNNLVLILDGLPQNIVKVAEKHRFSEQAKLAKLCEDTAFKIALVDSITWRLKKSLEPPFQKKRDLIWRSAPPDKPEIPPPPPRELTANEKDYLSFFTVYCALTDNVEDYGIDLSVEETDLRKFSVLRPEGVESPF